jgi:hypothetical protein
VRAALAVGELAIALVLLVGAGLLVRSFIALNSEDPGFATRGVLALRLHLPPAAYGEPPPLPANARDIPVPYDSVTPGYFSARNPVSAYRADSGRIG